MRHASHILALIVTPLLGPGLAGGTAPAAGMGGGACFAQSNVDYDACITSCVSWQSPSYVVDFCVDKCLARANGRFLRCLRAGRYDRGSWDE